jgi:hypothetical protein
MSKKETLYDVAKSDREKVTKVLYQIETAGNSAADLMAVYAKKVVLEDCEKAQQIHDVLNQNVQELRQSYRLLKPIESALNQEAVLLFKSTWWRPILRFLTIGLVSDGR